MPRVYVVVYVYVPVLIDCVVTHVTVLIYRVVRYVGWPDLIWFVTLLTFRFCGPLRPDPFIVWCVYHGYDSRLIRWITAYTLPQFSSLRLPRCYVPSSRGYTVRLFTGYSPVTVDLPRFPTFVYRVLPVALPARGSVPCPQHAAGYA